MHTRRGLLRIAAGALTGGVIAAACADDDRIETDAPSTAEPASTTSEPASTEPASTASAPPSTTSTPTTATTATTATTPATVATTQAATTIALTPPAPWAAADFAELDAFLERTNTDAFEILEAGMVVHEWYRNDASFARDVASAQKSVLSLLVGRAIGDGLFSAGTLVDDIIGSGWTTHRRTSAVTIHHLLTMTSGLDNRLDVVSEPGTAWLYSSAFAQLFAALEVAGGRAVPDLAREWLFEPAGAATATFYDRPGGGSGPIASIAPIGLRATAADLIAIGQAVLDRSQPALPLAWIDESLTPSQVFNGSYGLLWWLNGHDSFLLPGPAPVARPGPLIPSGPADLVAAMGKDEQRLYISSGLGLLVARLGKAANSGSSEALSSFDDHLWTMLTSLR